MGLFTPDINRLAAKKNWEKIAALLHHKRPYIRLQAFKALLLPFGLNTGNNFLKELTVLLDDHDPHVRLEAVIAFTKAGITDVMDKLLPVLEDGTANDKITAFRLLGSSNPVEDKIPHTLFTYGLNDKNNLVQIEAIRTIGKLRLEKLTDPVVKKLEHTKTHVRQAAIRTLGKIATDKAIDHLVGALLDFNPTIRKEARSVLEIINTPKTKKLLNDAEFNMLVKMMNGTVAMKIDTIRLIVGKKRAEGIPLIRKACSDKNKNVRFEAIHALRQWKDLGSLNIISNLLNKDKYYDIRLECLYTIESFNDPALIPLIEQARKDKNTIVNKEAQRLYYKMKDLHEKNNH